MKKVYRHRDAEMLMAATVIAKNFKEHMNILSPLRTNWSEEYANDLTERINQTIDNLLKLDYRSDLRDATSLLMETHYKAMRALSNLRIQIKIDFPKEKEEIYRRLGYSSSFRHLQRTNSQEKLLEMLAAFNQGMDQKTKNKLLNKNIPEELINEILYYAKYYKKLNTTQENLKQSTLKISQNARKAMNDLYLEVIGICKVARSHFSNDTILRQHFSFRHVLINLNRKQKKD